MRPSNLNVNPVVYVLFDIVTGNPTIVDVVESETLDVFVNTVLVGAVDVNVTIYVNVEVVLDVIAIYTHTVPSGMIYFLEFDNKKLHICVFVVFTVALKMLGDGSVCFEGFNVPVPETIVMYSPCNTGASAYDFVVRCVSSVGVNVLVM